jgi:tripartite-type tricarboxylate transporter receptor subunit TctC
VAQIGYVNFFLITNKEFGAKDFPQFVELVRRNPGKFNYASVGNGSPHHLFMEVLKKQYGLVIEHVPYKGTAAALPDVLSGKIQVMFADATIAVPNIQAGKVGVLGTSAARQNSLIPSVRPLAESVPGFDWTAWQGIAAPANTPREIVERVNAEVRRLLDTQEFREQLVRFGMEPAPPQTVTEFGEYVRADAARWAVVVRDSGARSD